MRHACRPVEYVATTGLEVANVANEPVFSNVYHARVLIVFCSQAALILAYPKGRWPPYLAPQ
jgi:hypothetical protein